MKYLLLLAALAALSGHSLAWLSEQSHDFGDIKQHEPVTHDFVFRNTGTEPLIIDNVRASCGCTAPEWSAAPVPPDSTGTIQLEYDARDAGYFRKSVKVYFRGIRKAERLYIEGYTE